MIQLEKLRKENQLIMFFVGHVASLAVSLYIPSPIMVSPHQVEDCKERKIRYLPVEKVRARQRRVSRIMNIYVHCSK
jgi:hypothetical protein